MLKFELLVKLNIFIFFNPVFNLDCEYIIFIVLIVFN